VKKNNREINLFNIGLIEKRNARSDKVKTTNVNILLNRVRLDKEKDFKKKLNFISILILCLAVVGAYSYLV
jgi:hypothetical protein